MRILFVATTSARSDLSEIWCSDLLKFQKTMLSLEDSRHETTDETGTTPRFKLIDPNHAWKRFNHEKKT